LGEFYADGSFAPRKKTRSEKVCILTKPGGGRILAATEAIPARCACPDPGNGKANMFENLRADLERTRADVAASSTPGRTPGLYFSAVTWVLICYRFGHWAETVHIPGVRQALLLVALILQRWVQMCTKSCIHREATIGPGLVLRNAYGVFIGPITKLGANCTLETQTLIDGSVGDRAYFGAGAKLLCHAAIGDDVVVSAWSVVLSNVMSGVTVSGVPARMRVPGRNIEEAGRRQLM
jgi:serine acetyltransferase